MPKKEKAHPTSWPNWSIGALRSPVGACLGGLSELTGQSEAKGYRQLLPVARFAFAMLEEPGNHETCENTIKAQGTVFSRTEHRWIQPVLSLCFAPSPSERHRSTALPVHSGPGPALAALRRDLK